ncbi:hypothetical protein IV57_GL000852 [Companilactobacillus kimchiensis]|uniref:Uncharacterized protein n=2 Tax=Companilactobacillus kimchiensis TaxID=993692 RepID=A0A0R2LAD3_9LACO|nr:hypothetical protein IV57_GL000852 [Companilactobacillus kimchiensis]
MAFSMFNMGHEIKAETMGHEDTMSKITPDNLMDTNTVTPYQTPTADPVILLFIWLTSGYNLQPENQYTYVNNPKTLYTDSGRSVIDALLGLGLLTSPSYTWYQSTDGQTWTEMTQKTKNLTVTPNKIGTVYYQQETQWKGLLAKTTTIYSQVAFITTFPEPIKATRLDVTADINYLYNNQSSADTTYVTGTPTPYNATGNITWKVDNTNLATVDSKTGLVTANTEKTAGTVRVTGTMTNADNTSVSGYVDIRIGGGLDNQTVDEGQAATFEIQGEFDEDPTKVVWHRIDVGGKDTIVENISSDPLIYKTAKTVYATDNGVKYYAVMTVTSGESTTTMTTNQALLTVKKNTVPALMLSNTIFNNSHNDHNDANTIIGGVSENDKVSYTINLNEQNVNSVLAKAELKLKLPIMSNVDAVKVNDQDYQSYQIIPNGEDTQSAILEIYDLDFVAMKNIKIEVDTTIGETSPTPFNSTGTLIGHDSKGNIIGTYSTGDTLTINFGDNKIDLKANDWNYGKINSYGVQSLLNREKIAGNPLEVSDNRRNKKGLKLYLAQNNPFKSEGNILNSNLRYYHSDGSFDVLNRTGTLISETADGQTLEPVNWADNEGPRLLVENGYHVAGIYSTELEWSLVESV